MKITFKELLLKTATILPAIIFVLAGLSKIIDPTASYERFVEWGYPGWFSTVIGFVELSCGIALMFPALTGLAAMVLGMDMLGAIFTHARAEEWGIIATPALLFLAMVYLEYRNRAELLVMMDKVLDFMHIPHRPHHV